MLAQTGVMADGSCCCHYMPCLPTCGNMCEEEKPPQPPLPPIIPETIPEPVNNVILNLDVIITHIMHELQVQNPQLPIPPVTAVQETQELVQNVVTPIVIQMIARDIAPVLPICTYEDGSSFYLNEPGVTHESTLPDSDELMVESLEQILSDLSSTVDPLTAEQIAQLDPSAIVEDMLINGPNSDGLLEVIIFEETQDNSMDPTQYGMSDAEGVAADILENVQDL